MRYALMILLLCFGFACRTLPDSSVKDEGITRVTGVSVSELIAKLRTTYQLSEDDVESLEQVLPKLIAATFKINCGEGRGSGVFTDAEGGFLTAAHVIAEDKDVCSLHIHEPDPRGAGRFVLKEIVTRVQVDEALDEVYSWDLARGRVEGIKPKGFMGIARRQKFADHRLLMAMGFPNETYRDGTQGQAFKDGARTMNQKACQADIDDIKRTVKIYIDLQSYDSISESDKQEYKRLERIYTDHLKRIVAACRYLEESEPSHRTSGYDLSDDVSAYITLGRSYFADGAFILTDLDSIPGMSGGPLVDVLSGELMGVVMGGIIGTGRTDAFFHTPDTIFSSVYPERLTQLAKEHRVESLACHCRARVYRDDGVLSDSLLMDTHYFRCLPDGDTVHECERTNGDRNNAAIPNESYSVYALLDRCQKVRVRSTTCNFFAGSRVRVIDSDGSTTTHVIHKDLGKYWYEWERP